MIVGLGIDIVELTRITRSLEKFGERFKSRILTPAESALVPANPIPFLAGRFAAKEAAVKALGTGFTQGISLHDIEILNDPAGKPCLAFHGHALRHRTRMNVKTQFVSISHGKDNAVAVVILEQ
ncbi:MAG: holo-[acyl-carrier-protein] synthase [Deltaproteobacteria bacterium]|nr:holo-[acyl-carrier-protein] synthase [Deltaproteobacteria bacterium]